MTSAALSVAFRHDSLTTASKASLERMAKTLGFTQNQTVLYALARLRDELQQAESASQAVVTPAAAATDYPDLSPQQFAIIRQHAPKRRGKPVRSSSLASLL